MLERFKIINCCCLFFITICLTMAKTCAAGGWTQPEGKLYSRLAINYYTADENFNNNGNRRDFPGDGDFSDVNTSLYMEYGLAPQLTLISNLTYKYLHYEDNAIDSKTYGIGDIELATRYRLWHDAQSAFSAQCLVKIPEAYDENKRVALGNGQYDVEFRLLLGRSLYPVIPGYFNIEAGYRFRCEEPADEVRYLVEMGVDITKRFYGRVKLDGILGIGNNDADKDIMGNPSATEDFDLGKLDICLGCNLTRRFGVEIACTPAIYGKNTAAGVTWTAALVVKL